MNTVSFVKCSSYTRKTVIDSIERALKPLGGMKAFVRKGQKVLIKPNMLTSGSKEKGISTHPEVVRAVIRLVKKAGGRPYVGDSPGFFSAQRVAKSNGILDVCKEESVELVEFKTNRKMLHKGLLTNNFPIANKVLDADLMINLCKVKTHGVTLFTGAIKNIFGCISGLHKARYHLTHPDPDDFSSMLVDLAFFLKPRLNIIDGVYGMEGRGGPNSGHVRKLGFIGASNSPAALDIAVCAALGYKDDEIMTNVHARTVFKVKKVEYPLLEPAQLKVQDFKKIKTFRQANFGLPEPVTRFFNNLFSAKPIVNKDCKSCMACVNICPARTIVMKKRQRFITKIAYVATAVLRYVLTERLT